MVLVVSINFNASTFFKFVPAVIITNSVPLFIGRTWLIPVIPFILIPFSISFFTQLSLPLIESINLSFTLENYLIYLIWVLIISSIIYQLPIFIIFFIKMGLIDLDWLKNNRSYIVIVFFILSALFTPPDPLSQILVALPLILLFEITIILVKVLNKKHE